MFVIAVAVVAIALFTWLAPAGRPVTVPPFIGMPFEQAKSLAQSEHIGLRVVAHRTDFHAPKDNVIGQLPSAGEKVRESRVIDVILSDGVPMVTTPNLSNLSLRDAKLALDNAHLVLGKVTEVQNLDVVAGQVLEQHPDPFTSLAAGSSVDVSIARGRPQMYTPSFVGMTLAFVRGAAKDAHITLGDVTQMPITQGAKPAGIVVAQDPPPGQALRPKQKVTLQVSSGGPATPTPSPTPNASGERRGGRALTLAIALSAAAFAWIAARDAYLGGAAQVGCRKTGPRRAARCDRVEDAVRADDDRRRHVVVRPHRGRRRHHRDIRGRQVGHYDTAVTFKE